MINFVNEGNIIEIVPYEELIPEIKEQVDKIVTEIYSMQYDELVPYGWDVQAGKNEMVNNVIVNSQSFSYENITGSIDDVMSARKSVMPREQSFFRKAYIPSFEEKKNFVGVVGELEQAIKAKIQDMFDLNRAYVKIALESKKIANSYAIIIMAIDKYLADNPNTDLMTILTDKRNSFLESRLIHINSMLQYPILCYNCGLAVNKLYNVINLQLHQLQEQLLIQSGVNEIKNVLSTCDGIKNAIYSLTENNIRELKTTTKKALEKETIPLDERGISEKMKKFNEALGRFGSLDMLESGEEVLKEAVEEKRTDIILKQKNIILASKSELQYLDHFVFIDKKTKDMIREWGASIPKPEWEKKEFLLELRKCLDIVDYDYGISLTLPSVNDDVICFNSSYPPAAIKAEKCEWLAKRILPKWESNIAKYLEIYILYGYYYANGLLDFDETIMYLFEYRRNRKIFDEFWMQRNDFVIGTSQLPMIIRDKGELCQMRGVEVYRIDRNIMNDEMKGEFSIPVVLYKMP